MGKKEVRRGRHRAPRIADVDFFKEKRSTDQFVHVVQSLSRWNRFRLQDKRALGERRGIMRRTR